MGDDGLEREGEIERERERERERQISIQKERGRARLGSRMVDASEIDELVALAAGADRPARAPCPVAGPDDDDAMLPALGLRWSCWGVGIAGGSRSSMFERVWGALIGRMGVWLGRVVFVGGPLRAI